MSDGIDRERLGELFERALSLPPSERSTFLDDVCPSQDELRRELMSLLDAHTSAPDRLDRMADEVMPAVLHALPDVLHPLGRIVSHYQIEALIGGGGMGVVYRARDLALGRAVALKVLYPHLTGDAHARARLASEARAVSSLDHPNIAVVYEIGTAAPSSGDDLEIPLFIAMAYYAGETIREKIGRGPLPPEEAVRYAARIAEGLSRAHEAGIVHGDIKPANVIVTERGELKIVDFGIARSVGADQTRPGETPGTLAYMSPEQTRGEPLDQRSDIWSLGVMLFEMLTGERPFQGGDDAALGHAIRHEAPRPLRDHRPGVTAALERIVESCLGKDANDRFQRTGELLAALQAIDGTSGETASGVRFGLTSGRIAAAGSLLILALAAGVVLVSPDSFPPRGSRTSDTRAIADASPPRISVFPFAAMTADFELERLGRDLVVTLTTGLDGIGALKTVDASATLGRLPSQGTFSLDDAHTVARGLSAGRFVYGVLTRAGADIRVDLSLFETGNAEPIVRTSARAADLPSLTDAAIIALLDELWEREPPDVPSLAAVKRSQVPAARRAYLAGELALARQDMAAALDAFERAFVEDSTFWWAYWRSLYPRSYREAGVPADPELLQQVVEHRSELPLQDRLLVEAWTTSSRAEQLSRLQELTVRFPDYSPAWWSYANLLCHYGGYFGRTAEDARAALERFLRLSPRFVAGWNHLSTAALIEGDSATASRAAHEEARWMADGFRRRYGIPAQALRVEVSWSGTIPDGKVTEAVDVILASPPDLAESLASGLVVDGSPAAQIQLNRATRARGTGRTLDVALWRGEALAWAARGAWDSALEAADRWSALSEEPGGPLGAYRLAIAGLMSGGLPSSAASSRRPANAPFLSPWSADERAELAWLDGLLAYLQRDVRGIDVARRALTAEEAAHGDALERSLIALASDTTGDRKHAAGDLVALERELADRGPLVEIGDRHPLLIAANRLIAARWLRSLGDHAGAARLLVWYESYAGGPLPAAWSAGVGRIGLLDRAEMAEAAGDPTRARRYYARFLRLYDAAVPALRPLVRRAAAGLERLGPESGRRDRRDAARPHPPSS